jgi:2'-5' RNA ligase
MTLTGPGRARLRDHGQWRPDWTVGRVGLLWFLTFEGQAALTDWQDDARALLEGSHWLHAVPTPWLHLTLTGLGFADELEPDEVTDVVVAARAGLDGFALPELRLGPVTGMEDSLVLGAAPVPELERLAALLRKAREDVLGPRADDDTSGYPPHVTVGYARADCDQDEAVGPLGHLASDLVATRATALTLAAATRHRHHYEWTVTDSVRLAGT